MINPLRTISRIFQRENKSALPLNSTHTHTHTTKPSRLDETKVVIPARSPFVIPAEAGISNKNRQKSSYKPSMVILLLGLFFVLSCFTLIRLSYAAWSEPTAAPSGNNTNPPVDTSSTSQNKTGALTVGSTTNFAATGMYAPIYYDSNNTNYYIQPSNTGTSAVFAGAVGIGITTPSRKLEVYVNDTNDDAMQVTNAGEGYATTLYTAGSSSMYVGQAGDTVSWNGTGNGTGIIQSTGNITLASPLNVPRLTVLTNGNVGIGTTTPTAQLNISSAGQSSQIVLNDTTDGTGISLTPYWPTLGFNGYQSGTTTYAIGSGYVGLINLNPTNGAFQFVTLNNPGANSIATGVATPLTILNNGDVGIGTATPDQPLTVAGTIHSTTGGIEFPDGTTQTTAAGVGSGLWAASGSNIYNTNAGNVGIGTNSPSYKLLVAPGGAGSGLGVGWNAISGTGETDFYNYGQGGSGGFNFWNYPNSGSSYPTSGATNLLTITSGGEVGIGTSSPNAQLTVNGINRSISTNNWADMSADSSGFGLFAGNAYTPGSGGQFAYSNSHSSIGAIGFAVNYPSWNQASVITSGTTAATAGQIFTPTAIATFNYNGNVGIGTTTPRTTLDVWGGTLSVTGSDHNGTASITSQNGNAYFGVNGYQDISVNPSGYVGIDMNPITALSVSGEILAAEGLPGACPGAGGYSFVNDGCYDTGMFSNTDGDLRLYSNNTLGLAVEGGNVGIGTTTTSNSLLTLNGLGSSGTSQVNMIEGNYGAMWRNDGGSTYFLLTNSGNQYGGFNGLRPLAINDSSGFVAMSNGLSVTGGLSADSFNVGGIYYNQLGGQEVIYDDTSTSIAANSDYIATLTYTTTGKNGAEIDIMSPVGSSGASIAKVNVMGSSFTSMRFPNGASTWTWTESYWGGPSANYITNFYTGTCIYAKYAQVVNGNTLEVDFGNTCASAETLNVLIEGVLI